MLHSRRLRSTLFAGMVAALGATTSLAPARAQPASAPGDQGPPNILFVLVDDMGYGDLSIMGNTKIETPNLDKLAREGVLITKFYVAAPLCRSEERRVGKECVIMCRSRCSPYHLNTKKVTQIATQYLAT